MKINHYSGSDYYGATAGHHKFYYGYERTMCEHGKDSTDCNCCKEWCFTAEYCGREVRRFTAKQMKLKSDDMNEGLIKGMLAYLLNCSYTEGVTSGKKI